MEKIQNKRSPISKSEKLTTKQKINEKIGFGLRLNKGIDIDTLPKVYKKQLTEKIYINQKKWVDCIKYDNQILSLKEKGFAYADSIAVDIMI